MSQSFVQLALDGAGKKIDTQVTATAAQHRQVVVLGDPLVDVNIMGVTAAGMAKVDGSAVVQPISGTVQPGNTPNTMPWLANPSPLLLSVTATGAAAAAVTATLPAIVSKFHYIHTLEIMAYTTAARTGGATPNLVTSTNLPGSNVWTFATAAAIGTTDMKLFTFSNTYRSLVADTATTIVCPAKAGVIWRINIFYYGAA